MVGSSPRSECPYMPDYGVDVSSWEPLPWEWAASRLDANRNFWVVTVSEAARPHALPVWGVWDDGAQRFVFSCGPKSRKARNLQANSQTVITTDSTVECVSIEGRSSVVQDEKRRTEWFDLYLTKYRPIAPSLTADFLGENLLVEFAPERAFAVIEREDEFASRATRWVFD